MVPQAGVEFKRSPVVKHQAGIVTPRGRPKQPLLPDRHAIDQRAMAGDLAHGIARVGRDAVPELLFAFSHRDDPRRITVPCQVVDPAPDHMVFPFRRAFSHAVPYPHRAGRVSARDVVSRGGESGYGRTGGMGRVLRADGRVVDRSKED